MRLVVCASREYLAKHGVPARPKDLARHNCLTYEYALSDAWVFRDPAGGEHAVRVAGSLNSNNGDLNAAAAIEGVGIALEPDFIVGAHLTSGSLVPVLEGFAAPVSPIYAVYPSRRFLPAKIRAFVDFLVERFSGMNDWS